MDGIPAITYHPKCRKIFTMKRDLEKMKSSNETNMDTSLTKIPRADLVCDFLRLDPSPRTSILHPACIFCEKKEKYKKRKRETLLNCSMFSADNTLRETAKLKNDSRMMAITSNDLIASEAKYHVSCYKDYTRLKKAKYDESYDLKEDPYDIAESEAFLELTEFCFQLIDEPRVVKFTELVDIMETVMNNREQSLKASTKKNLRRKLERHIVGIEFQIVDSALYVYPSTLSHNMIISEFVKVSNKLLQNTNLNNTENIILSAAQILRNEMKNTKDTIPWPPKAGDLTKEEIEITHFADMFFNKLLSGTSYTK